MTEPTFSAFMAHGRVFDVTGCFECGEGLWAIGTARERDGSPKFVALCTNCGHASDVMYPTPNFRLRTHAEFEAKEVDSESR